MTVQEVNHIELEEHVLDASIDSPSDSERLVTQASVEKLVSEIKVDLRAVLGEVSMTVKELYQLKSGDVVKLDTLVDQDIGLFLNEGLVAVGRLVTCGDNFGVQITKKLEINEG